MFRTLALLLGLLPAALLAAEAVCPLPEADAEKAVRAFSEMAQAFQDPRCSNCHGAVNPFAEDGGHAGGKVTLDNTLRALGASRATLVEALTRANGGTAPSPAAIADAEAALRTFRSTDGPLTDRAAIADILKAGGLENAAYAPCAECHQNRPAPWQPATSLWAGKSEEALCAFFQKTMDVSDFLQHVTEDQLGLVQAGFAGTRGLTTFGQAFLKGQTGRDYKPEPPRNSTLAGFTAAGNRWIDGLGGRFHKPPECGCSVRKYRLVLKGAVDVRVAAHGGVGTSNSRSDQVFDLAFKPDGRFTGQARATVPIVNVANAPGASCRSEMTIDQTIDIEGRVDETSGLLSLKVTSSGLSRPATQTCTVAGRTIRTTIPAVRSGPDSHSFEMPALVDVPKTISFDLGAGTMSGEIRIERR